MSNSLLPIPTYPTGSRGWPIKKAPRFNTITETPLSFRGETRISTTPYCVWDFELTFPLIPGTFNDGTSYLNLLTGHYLQHQGMAQSWLYDDPQDDTILAASPAIFGLGDGTTSVFQLTRPIGNYADIIQNLNGTPIIYLNGVANTANSISSLGVVTFNSSPANGTVLAWSGKYYFRCRFSDDSLSGLTQIFTNIWNLANVKFQSIIL